MSVLFLRRSMFRQAQTGFTLIELLITVAILGIVVAIAAPSFDNTTLSSKLRSYSNSMVSSVMLARSEAIKRNSVVRMCVANSAGDACAASAAWAGGWLVFHDADNDGAVDAGEAIIQWQQAAASGYNLTQLTGTTGYIVFQGDGLGTASFTMTVCRATPSVGAQERSISVSTTGRTSVDRTTAGTCP